MWRAAPAGSRPAARLARCLAVALVAWAFSPTATLALPPRSCPATSSATPSSAPTCPAAGTPTSAPCGPSSSRPTAPAGASLAEELTREPDTWTQFAGWSPDGKTAIIGRGWQSPENAQVGRGAQDVPLHARTAGSYDSYLLDLATRQGDERDRRRARQLLQQRPVLLARRPDEARLHGADRRQLAPLPHGPRRQEQGRPDRRTRRSSPTASAASPDGKRIAYHKNYQVYLADADGSNAVHVKTGKPFNFVPTWSPDGKWVLFLSGEHYNCHPHVVRADGTGLKKLADRGGYRGVIEFLDVPDFHGGSSDMPVWSADGKSVFYTAQVGKSVELFRVTLDGKTTQLHDDAGRDAALPPAASPDGKWLVYGSKARRRAAAVRDAAGRRRREAHHGPEGRPRGDVAALAAGALTRRSCEGLLSYFRSAPPPPARAAPARACSSRAARSPGTRTSIRPASRSARGTASPAPAAPPRSPARRSRRRSPQHVDRTLLPHRHAEHADAVGRRRLQQPDRPRLARLRLARRGHADMIADRPPMRYSSR